MLRFRPRAAAALVALVVTTAPVLAQQPAPSPSHLAAAREVAILTGVSRTLDSLLPELYESLRRIAVTRPELGKDLNEVIEGIKPEMEQRKQEVVDATAQSFAGRMSESELREVVNFFQSPSGQKFSQVEPLVTDDTIAELGRWARSSSEFAMDRLRTEMAKRGHQIQ